MGFVQHEVERQIRVFDGVLDCVPDRVRPQIRHNPHLAIILFDCGIIVIVTAHKKAVLGEFLRV
jgi:hypothetical protein